MKLLDYNKTFFLKSYTNIKAIKIQNGIEIVFIGYSNSGKSSAINALTNQKKLSRISKYPGRTQLINFFQVVSNFRIVDLPGYGFAKVPFLIRENWQKKTYEYLEKRDQIKGLILLMDIRHPLKIFDYKTINIALRKNISILVLLTKCDKLKINEQKKQYQIVYKKLRLLSSCEIELFSSFKKIGIEKLKLNLNNLYNNYFILNN